MSPMSTGYIVLVSVFGGAVLGMVLQRSLPAHHVSTDSKDVIKLTQMSANIILLDRVLAQYGPETKIARDLLRRTVLRTIDQIWPETDASAAELDPKAIEAGALYYKIEDLLPQNETQRTLKTEAEKMSIVLAQTRWLLFEQGGSSIPMPFMVLLIFWVTIIFLSFGLFAPPNATVIATLFLCALPVSGAIFLILELDRPFGGLIQISNVPLTNAAAHIGQ